MSDVIETLTSEDGKWRVRFMQDYDCSSPREMTQLGTMLTWTRNYNSPDDNPFREPQDFIDWWNGEGDFADSGETPPRLDPRYVRLNVYMLDHSGISFRTTDFGDRWDSGQVGWIFTTPEKIEETGAPEDSWKEQLKNEVEEYSKWANGECYGYMMEKLVETCDKCHSTQWEHVDSCWGFIGHIYDLYIPEEMPADLVAEVKDSYFTEEAA
jgi:hypothetical protein